MPTDWNFDPITAIVTVIIVPLLLFLGKLILHNLKDWSQYALDGILYRMGKRFKLSIASWLTLRQYCGLMLRGQSKTLPVPSKRDIVLDTDSVFVPLRLEEAASTAKDLTHENILEIGSRIRIVGDPGSGKSSLIKKMFRDACYAAMRRRRGMRLPILVELRDLEVPENDDTESTWLLDELRRRVSKAAVYKMSDCFDTYSQTDGWLILLDGLDEVATQRYPVISRLINGLSDALAHLSSRNAVVVTLRTHFHQQVRESLSSQFPHAAYVKPFTPTDIYEFLTRWPYRTDSREVVQIYRDLMDRPTLQEMCTNPLVLAMYVADYQATGETLIPDTRTEFYTAVTEELLIKRRLRQTGAITGKSTLREQRERVLGSIAFAHLLDHEQPTNSIPWQFSVQVAAEAAEVTATEAENLLRDIGKETGIIAEERHGESIRFIHLTFCEFLAAKQAVQGEEHGWSQLTRRHADFRSRPESGLHARLVEAIAFGAGLCPRSKRTQVVQDVLELDDPRLTIRAFLETKLYNHPGWKDFIHSEVERLGQQPVDMLNSDWLHSVHLFNVVVRDAKIAAQHMQIQMPDDLVHTFVQGIREKGSAVLSALFSALATHDAAAALRLSESAGFDLLHHMPEIVIRCCDQEPFFAMIQHRAAHNSSEHDRVVQLVAEAALRSPVVRSLVRQEVLPAARQLLSSGSKSEWLIGGFGLDKEYAALIAVALERRKSGERLNKLPLLGVLDESPSPRTYRWLRVADLIGTTMMLPLILAFFYVIATMDMADVAAQFGIANALLVILLILSISVTSTLFAAVRRTYRYLLYGSFRLAFELNLGLPEVAGEVGSLVHPPPRVRQLLRPSIRTSLAVSAFISIKLRADSDPQTMMRLLPPRLRAALVRMARERVSVSPTSSFLESTKRQSHLGR